MVGEAAHGSRRPQRHLRIDRHHPPRRQEAGEERHRRSTPATAAKVKRSLDATPKSSDCINRERSSAPPKPSTSPTATTHARP